MATLVKVECLAHAWSGGASNERFSDKKVPDASRMAWAFTTKQFIRQSQIRRDADADGAQPRAATG